jgi:hypothetical protein
MTHPHIYADFNGLERIAASPPRYSVALDTLGTLRDLSNAGIRLVDGLQLLVWDESDETEELEGEAAARFDLESGVWWADLMPEGYRYVPKCERAPILSFLCFGCRRDLGTGNGTGGWAPRAQLCPYCGTDIRAAIAPPAA